MKKTLIALFSVVAIFGFGGTASAAVNCTITNTGPGSVNTCEFDDETTVDYECNNGVLINTENDQVVTTGDAENLDNTNSGDATSGDAGSEYVSLVDVVTECAATAQAEEPEKPVTPAPEKEEAKAPEGQVIAAVTPEAQPEVLPSTGESNMVSKIATATIGSLALAVIAKVAISIYRRKALN